MWRALFIALFVCVSIANAQQRQVDSLRTVYQNASDDTTKVTTLAYIAFHMAVVHPDSAIKVGEEALEYAKSINFARGIASANNSLGWIYFNKGNIGTAFNYYNEALTYFEQTHNEVSQLAIFVNLSSAYIKKGSLADAMTILSKAIPIAERNLNTNEAAYIYKNMGIMYRQEKQYDKAIVYFEKAIQLNIEQGNINFAADSKISLGILRFSMGDTVAADREYESAKDLYESANNTYGMAIYAENKGSLRFNQNRIDDALSYYLDAKKSYEQLGYKADIAYISLEIAKIYNQVNNHTASISILDEALLLARESEFKNYIYEILDYKSVVYESMGNLSAALAHGKLAKNAYVEFQADKQADKLAELQLQFETAQKDNEIVLLNKDNELQEQRIERQRILLILGVLAALFVLTVVGFFVYRYRLKMQTKEIALRSKIAADLHDEVGSSVSSIRMLSEIAIQQGPTNTAFLHEILTNIKDSAKDIVENTGDIVWMIKPGFDDIETVIERMDRYIHDVCSHRDIVYTLDLNELRSIKLSMVQRKNVYLIFKEAVNNAAKYADTKNLHVVVKIEGKRIFMMIKDFGKGFDMLTTPKGNGLDNMFNRASELGGVLQIESTPGAGTQITLSLPV